MEQIINNEYVIVYKTGTFNREAFITAQNREDAITKFKDETRRFKKTVGDYEVQSCELSDEGEVEE